MKALLINSIIIFLLVSCGKNPGYKIDFDNISINNFEAKTKSSSAGNLIADALVSESSSQIALYPVEFLSQDQLSIMSRDNLSSMSNSFEDSMPSGSMDQFRVGTMRGRDIKDFITQRVMENYQVAFQVSGIKYHFHFVGGIAQYSNFTYGKNNDELKDNEFYKILISDYFYFSGQTFPSYKYRNSIDRIFNDSGKLISARQSVSKYILKKSINTNLTEQRVLVTKYTKSDLGYQKISSVQGSRHISPILGHIVETSGVVTAVGYNDFFPGGYDIYIQSTSDDGRDDTSEALRVYLPDDTYFIEVGDFLNVRGSVYEKMTTSGLSETSIMDVSSLSILSKNNPLPRSISLGEGGRVIPNEHSSTYRGNVNDKESLNLGETLDFMESLEGMRVRFSNSFIVGFRGGNQDYEDLGTKGNLTLFVKVQSSNLETHMQGALQDLTSGGHHFDILSISTGHLTKGIVLDTYYKVGDFLDGEIEGNLIYQANLFGGGEYTVVLPRSQASFETYRNENSDHVFTNLEDRPRFLSKSDEDSLTIATYNVENLSSNQLRRMIKIGKMIKVNLNCPDILNLVEIQDDNGELMSGGSSAKKTLENLISNIECGDVKYKAINIDPENHSDGGVPGGNIRVAMIYNAAKLKFESYGNAHALTDLYMKSDGSLSHNPARLFSNDPLFKRTRKSIVAEFEYRNRKILVVGNHLNSKLGDTDPMGAIQPFVSNSEIKRVKMASKLNDFISNYTLKNSNADVYVMGDFNANMEERSMKVLAGESLINTMGLDKYVAKNMRYTTNHNGLSQPLDYIFVSRNVVSRLVDVMPVHINSDYMGRLSDHDPVILKATY